MQIERLQTKRLYTKASKGRGLPVPTTFDAKQILGSIRCMREMERVGGEDLFSPKS